MYELVWKKINEGHWEALLGSKDDGVTFCVTKHMTCYRRGPWRVLIEVCGGENHHKWGCFDLQDQPLRYFHKLDNLISEVEAIASVLRIDRIAAG